MYDPCSYVSKMATDSIIANLYGEYVSMHRQLVLEYHVCSVFWTQHMIAW